MVPKSASDIFIQYEMIDALSISVLFSAFLFMFSFGTTPILIIKQI